MRTRKTSTALVELRTAMNRALTGYREIEKHRPVPEHTPHEIELIRTALKNAHDVLYRADLLTGYEGRDD